MSVDLLDAPTPTTLSRPARQRSKRALRHSESHALLAGGEPMLWLTGGALAIAVAMIVGLLGLVLYEGLSTFWPVPVVRMETKSGKVFMGEVTRTEKSKPALNENGSESTTESVGFNRRLVRTGNFESSGTHFEWVSEADIARETAPQWAVVLERLEWGRFYGTPESFMIDGVKAADTPDKTWALFKEHLPAVRKTRDERRKLEVDEIGYVNAKIEKARLREHEIELKKGKSSPAYAAAQKDYEKVETWATTEFNQIRAEIDRLNKENDRYQMVLKTAQGQEKMIPLAEIVRAYPANQMQGWNKARLYVSRWWEFLSREPREANSEGGVFPAIFGTISMTLIMSLLVVPFGVLAALYLHEYAKSGTILSAVRIAVNNLAGVPSIVFGVFGLGFFCYIIGGTLDQFFFAANLPNPTYGKGALVWASLTLALLTLPVVIVATEEALSAVPNSIREGSYACGAGKWQTIRRIVLPSAMPGIMTGMILAMARGAGEVAPLMLVGAVKLAPQLPVDKVAPFLHPDRSFMHLGFHLYDLGFQSQNSEAAKPMVYTTTLLLILIIALLNLSAVWLRGRLRKRLALSKF